MVSIQLPLSIGLSSCTNFDNYVVGPNAEAHNALQDLLRGDSVRLLNLWGRPGTGKTHLAQAACQYVGARGLQGAFVPLDQIDVLKPEILNGLADVSLLCLDDVEHAAGNAGWERALFNLYNEAERAGTPILFTAATPVTRVDFALQDLRSRLASALSIQLKQLCEADREAAVRSRARERGFEIPPEVMEFVMRRHPRSMHELIAFVDKLDRSTLAARRRVTIPFVKQLLDADVGEA